jgi:two-component system, cell cycle sensor histidine kinase and response regulator CckA
MSPFALAALALLAVGLAVVVIAQRRALRRAAAARREADSRIERLERNLQIAGEGDWPAREDAYRTPLNQIRDYTIFLIDAQGKPTSWNPGVHHVLGYERDEFLETTAADLYTPEDQELGLPAADLSEAIQQGRSSADRWLVRKDGGRVWVSMSTSSVHDRQGQLLGCARRLRDLSEIHQAEEQLHRKQDALELAHEAAGLGMWEHDLSTGESSWDERARALVGLPATGSVTYAQWLNAIHPEDREATIERWARALRDRTPYSAEYRVVWPDGSIHSLVAVGRYTADATTGTRHHFTGVLLDLTERRRTEEHLQESLRLEALGRLAGGVAHDLNNMLAAILGFSDLLGKSFDRDDPRGSDVEQICRAAERSAGLTRQLLAFARRELIQPRPLDLNAVIRQAKPMLPPVLGESIEVVLDLAPNLGVVFADSRQVEQILMNLVLNARDAMPRGGRITLETRSVRLQPGAAGWRELEAEAPGERFAMLSVSDTGLGMDAATLQRIWEPFFTTKPVGKGTGLGLSSVYGAAKQSGGFVWADSEPGRGTAVQVYWPEIPAEAEPLAGTDAPAAVEGGHETVLVVEDEELVRALAVRTLRDRGYRCLEAHDAGEALRLVQQEEGPLDLVITDVVMPGMSGGGLGDRLALLRPGLPILYTSAFTDEDVIRRGMLEQGRPFLQKPCRPDELARVVREVLDAAATRDQPEIV